MAEYFDHFLIKIKGPKGQWTEKISHHSFFVGRVPPCDLVLDATFISRKHARIFIEDGNLWLEDLKSSNGVFLNGVKIKPGLPVQIDLESKISFGETDKIEIELELVMTSEAPVGDELKAQASLALGKLSDVLGTSLHLIRLKVERKEKLIERVRKEAKDIISATRQEREDLMKKSQKEGEKAVKKAKEQALKIVKDAEDEAFQTRKEIDREVRKKREEIDSQQVTLENLKDEIERRTLEIKEGEKAFELIQQKQTELQNLEVQILAEQKALESLKKAQDHSNEQTQIAQTEKDRLEKQTTALRKDLDELEQTLRSLEAEKNLALEQIQSTQIEKKHLQKVIDELIDEKKHLRNFLDEEKGQLEKLRLKIQAEAEAERSHVVRQAEQEKAAKLAHTERECEELLQKVRAQAQSLEEAARTNSAQVIEKAKSEANELIKLAEIQASNRREKLNKELGESREKAERELEKVLQKKATALSEYEKINEKAKVLIKDAELEATQKKESSHKILEEELLSLRAKALYTIEQDQKLSEEKYHEYLKVEASSIQKRLIDAATTDLKSYLKDPNDHEVMTGVEGVLSRATQSVLLGVDFTEEEIEKHLKERPTGQQQKNRNFFKRAALMTMGVILCALSAPFVMDQVGESARELAHVNDVKETEMIKEMEVQREELNRFTPEIKTEYEKSYTDRVLHNEGYVESELKSSYREKWIVQLNEHLVSQLQLNEDIVVAFIAQEANLIRELKGVKDTINGQHPGPGIERMRETEKRFLDSVKKLAGSKKNVDKILEFKKSFYLKHAAPVSIDQERLPAETRD